MPTPISYPLINGVRYDFSSVELNFNGLIQRAGIKALSYKHSLTPGELRGNRPQLVGRTRGKYEASASFEMFKLEYQSFIAAIGCSGTWKRPLTSPPAGQTQPTRCRW